MKDEVRVLVVDGDPQLRQRFVQEAAERPGITVVATAMGFRTGLPKIESYHPDVVLVDLVNDAVEGIELVEHLHRQQKEPVLLGLVSEGPTTARAQRAKELGARIVGRPREADGVTFTAWVELVIARCREVAGRGGAGQPAGAVAERPAAAAPAPVGGRDAEAVPDAAPPVAPRDTPARDAAVPPAAAPPVLPREAAPERPSAAERARAAEAAARIPATARAQAASARPVATAPQRPLRRGNIDVVGIGISTGGPKALAQMLPMLPESLPVPVLIVQHMPPVFTASLADSLARQCKMPVREARAGETVRPGEILIAPGGKHMRVVRAEGSAVVVRITEDPPENSCRPAVDYLFRSLGEVYGQATLAVMMTGMGEDGFLGCKQLHGMGARIVAQDEASCTVYGMPRGPVQAGIADVVAPLDQIAARIVEIVKGNHR